MTSSSSRTDRARAELYKVMNRDLGFEEKADRALEIGRDFLGVDNAHFTTIDPSSQHWEAVASTDPTDGQFPPGLILDLDSTYCRRTIDQQESIALHDAENQGWDTDPAFQVHGLSTYHGTPVVPGGNVYGTLCFVSEQPRDEPFSEAETLFAEFIARMLEFELRRLAQEHELNRRANLISVLNRVLRHNLRNDLNVIQGRVELLAKQLDDDSVHIDSIRSSAEALLSISEKVRSLELSSLSDFDRRETAVSDVIDRIVTNVVQQYPSASVSQDVPEDLTVEVFDGFSVAVREVIENAAKHSAPDPEIRISADVVPNALELVISDNGPGIPDQEREALQGGEETPLMHGSGFGLWLVHWLITRQNGALNISVDEEGTTISMTIPRTPITTEVDPPV